MSEKIKLLIKKNSPHFKKYKKYIQENNWSKLKAKDVEEGFKGRRKTTVDLRLEEFNVQEALIKAILERLKVSVKRAEGDHHLKIFKDFVKETLSIISIHTDRADDYISTSNISSIEDLDLRANEIAFHNTLFKAVSSIDDTVSALNIKDDSSEAETEGIEFLNGTKAPLSMHKVLSEIYPEINKRLEEMGIDFNADPGNDFHIHNPNPPIWNTSKHYWQQERSTLEYYVKEFNKLERGIVVDGYYISGWMYYHVNVFVTPIPHSIFNDKNKQFESVDKIVNPPLRDSDVMVFENYENAKNNKILITFIAATRRAAKTTLESSKLGHAATIGKKELLCAGGSAKDLNQIAKNFKTDIQYKNPAFAVFNVANDWKDKVELGLKTKSNKTILLSTLYIINTDSGNNEEILAGFTPDEFVFDEIFKSKFIAALEGIKPALKGADGLIRCYPILSGTGGSEALSVDALTVLNDPVSNEVMPMNWEILERGVPVEYRSWQEDRLRPFGTFIPGQCCVDMPKIDSTLGDYLGKEGEGLKKIKLRVTDWEKATKKIEETREKKRGNKVAYTKEVVYIPIKPSEIFMSGRTNPFPINEAKAHKQHLIETGKWDRRRDVYRDSNGKIQLDVSTKPLVEFPISSPNMDAPCLILEDPPTEKVKYGTYTTGFDDYKQEEGNEENSIATKYIWKNEILGDKFSKKLVASLSFRPKRHQEVYEKWLLLMELYQIDGTAFGENEDFAIKEYLDRKGLTEKYLAPSLDFSTTFNIPNTLKRKFGWQPNTTKRVLFNLFVEYCNEEFEYENEDGTIVRLKGVQRIDDIWLLEEIIQWNENLNVDRLTAALGAWGYIHYLQSSHKWKVRAVEKHKESEENKKLIVREKSFYGNRDRIFYRNRR